MFKRIALILAGAVVLGGCDDVQKTTITRTADSPQVLEQSADVPVYSTECHTVTVFGQSSYCGYHQECHEVYDNPNHYDPDHDGDNDGDHDHDGGGHHDHYNPNPTGPVPHGPHYNPHPHGGERSHTECYSVTNSCYHPETVCSDYLDHTTHATLHLVFDQNAVLLPGEAEQIKLTFSGKYAVKTMKMDIDSARYRYSFPSTTTIDMGGTQSVTNVGVKVDSVKTVRPPNNLRIVSAQYVDAQTLRIQFEDPYRYVREIRDSVYKFEVKRGLNTYVDTEVRASQLANQPGAFVVEIRKGTPDWRRDPRPGHEHTLKFSVERESALFSERASEKQELKIRF